MLVPFSTLPDHARVWIYPASRPFTVSEKEEISETLTQFLNQWAAHGSPLKTDFDLEIVCLRVDPSELRFEHR